MMPYRAPHQDFSRVIGALCPPPLPYGGKMINLCSPMRYFGHPIRKHNALHYPLVRIVSETINHPGCHLDHSESCVAYKEADILPETAENFNEKFVHVISITDLSRGSMQFMIRVGQI